MVLRVRALVDMEVAARAEGTRALGFCPRWNPYCASVLLASHLRREVPVGGSCADLAFPTFAPDGTRSLSPSKPSQRSCEGEADPRIRKRRAPSRPLPPRADRISDRGQPPVQPRGAANRSNAPHCPQPSGPAPSVDRTVFSGVEAKAESFDADVAARGRPGTDVKDQHGETNALLDVAWPRSDRGLFWCDAARSAPHTVAPEAQLYIDVLAPKQLEKRVGRSKRDGMPVSCLGYSSSRRSRGLLTASGSSPGNASLAPR